jgi:PAS domain S-box-containing protein
MNTSALPGHPVGQSAEIPSFLENARLVAIFRRAARVASVLTLGIGIAALVGWAVGVDALTSLGHGLASMKPNTAAAFVLAGVSLWMTATARAGRESRFLQASCAAMVAVMGLLTGVEYLSGRSLGIDLLLFRGRVLSAGGPTPGRMAPMTAIGLVALGSALIAVATRRFRIGQVLALVSGVVSTGGVLGYLYGVEWLYRLGHFNSMALTTSVAFVACSLGVMFVRADRGFASILVSDSAGGRLARRLLPAALGAPPFLGALRLAGQRAGYYDTSVGLALMVMAMMVLFGLLIVLVARSLGQSGSIVELSRDAMFTTDRHGIVRSWNPAAERLYGHTPQEIVGRPIDALVPSWRSGEEGKILTSILDGQALDQMETERVRRDGTVIHVAVSVSPRVDPEGRIIGASAIARDITDRKAADAALHASETRFRVLSESAFEGIVIHDGRRLLDTNRSFPSMFGYERDEVVGMEVSAFIAPESRDLVRAKIEAGFEGPFEATCLRKDGSRFTVQACGRAIPYQGRTVRGVALADISRMKEAAEDLRLALEIERLASDRLRELDELKDTFVRAVSHDLRTPLAVILWLAEALAADPMILSPEEAREFLGRIAANAKALDRLVLDLLDLDRLNRGGPEIRFETVDLPALVGRVVEGLDVAEDHPVSVRAEPVTVSADPALIERVVENLVINGVRHTPPRTEVWITVRAEDGGALVMVEDAGPGVPPACRRDIFEPFRRGPGDRRSASGLGIGLALVARFTELHGGRAWVEERPGGGASFRVFLPGAAA